MFHEETVSSFFIYNDLLNSLLLQKTSILKTSGTCQLTKLPEYMNVPTMVAEFESNDGTKGKEINKHENLFSDQLAVYVEDVRQMSSSPSGVRACTDLAEIAYSRSDTSN